MGRQFLWEGKCWMILPAGLCGAALLGLWRGFLPSGEQEGSRYSISPEAVAKIMLKRLLQFLV
jgi:hypothetical protein